MALRSPRPPTPRQLELHAWMLEFSAANGMPPSIREICDRFGVSSTNAVACTLSALVRKGLVRHAGRRARAYVPIGNPGTRRGAASGVAPSGSGRQPTEAELERFQEACEMLDALGAAGLHLYAAGGSLHLMTGPSHDDPGAIARRDRIADAAPISNLSGGDW